MRAYYNDHDKNVCAWLEQLIKNGDITNGDVDDRSVTEIKPDDITGYDRVHFFAGIGTWDFALNRAGWGDRPIWTASLPCQPFSAAGKGRGKEDERHLLPAYLDLVKKCRPNVQIGEQVERAIAHGWLDDLQAVMEAEGYAIGHCVLGAHSVNAAHVRQRLYWVAHADSSRSQKQLGKRNESKGFAEAGLGDWLAYTSSERYEKQSGVCGISSETPGNDTRKNTAGSGGMDSRLANTYGEQNNSANKGGLHAKSGGGCGMVNTESDRFGQIGYCNTRKIQRENRAAESEIGLMDGIEWLYCRDDKYRPVKSGIKPLVDGTSGKLVRGGDTGAQIEANNTQEARAMRLKGYGNAIQAATAIAFIKAFMEA